MDKAPSFTVAYIFDGGRKLVLNGGADQGVQLGQIFLVFSLGQDIIDPVSKRSLGKLEIVKGRGRVVHCQENISTVESSTVAKTPDIKRIYDYMNKNIGFARVAGFARPEIKEEITPGATEVVPFEDVSLGDYARLIG